MRGPGECARLAFRRVVGAVQPSQAISKAGDSPGTHDFLPEQNAVGDVHIASAKTSPGGVKARCLSETCIAQSRRAKLSE